MGKKVIARIIGIITMVAAIAIVLYFGQLYIFRAANQNAVRIEGFHLEEEDSLDMVILGSSDVYAGFAPARAYAKQGITSYDYAISANLGILLKYELKDILSRQNPKVLVVEVNGLTYDDNRYTSKNRNLAIIDALPPYSKARDEMIDYAVDENLIQAKYPLLRYHLPTDLEFMNMIAVKERGKSLFKGALVHKYKVEKPMEWKKNRYLTRTYPLNPVAKRTFLAFMNQCKEAGIEHVVFAKFPHIVHNKFSGKRSMRYNEIERLAVENGFDFVDLDKEKGTMGLDSEKDFRDAEHLSYKGQRKLTDYLSKYLVEKYHIEPRKQSEENAESWAKSAEYDEYMYEYMESQDRDNPRILPYMSKVKNRSWPVSYVTKINQYYSESFGLYKALENIKNSRNNKK